MRTFTTDNKTISIFPCSESESPVIYLNTFLDESQKVYEPAQATGCLPFTLVAVSDLDWNHDMAPPGIVTRIQKCGARTTIFAS